MEERFNNIEKFDKILIKGFPLNKLNKNIFLEDIHKRDHRQWEGVWGNEDLFDIRRALGVGRVLGKAPQAPAVLPVHQVEIVPGTQEGLARFMVKEPQRDQRGRFRYLLTSGVAVEIITGTQRFHHDIDLVIFDYRDQWWRQYLTDNVVAQQYWADMKFDPAYLEETAWEAKFTVQGQDHTVSTVHPAIIMTQKLSDAWGRMPRKRDLKDVMVLARFWLEHERGSERWVNVVEAAIAALPKVEQPRTQDRIAPYLEEARKWREGDSYHKLMAQFIGLDIVPRPLIQACQP